MATANAILKNPQDFTKCPDTGMNLYTPLIPLIKACIITGVIFLFAGGALGFLVAATRLPALHLLPSELFYIALTGHGAAVLLFWIHIIEVGFAYFFCTTPINARLATPKLAWISFYMMVAGAATATVIVLLGLGTVMFSAYPPLMAHPLFYIGIIVFAVGGLISNFIVLATLSKAKNERTYEGSMPLATFGIAIYAIIGVFTWVTGAIILIPTALWSMGLIANIDAQIYRIIFWACAHSTQQMNIVLHITIWYTLASVLFGAKPLNEKISRTAFFLYLVALQFGSVHHLLSDPGSTFAWRTFNTSYAAYLAVLGSLIHGLTVPGGIELAQRRQGLTNGLWEWLRKAPWENPVCSGLFLSIVGFGFLGGITGVTMSNQQINMIIHNTFYVPAHFHGTVACGTTLAFFAFSYWLVPILTRKKLAFPVLAKFSTWMFGLGMGLFSLIAMAAGHLGIPRRHWDITYADASLPFEFGGTAHLLFSIGELGAMVGGVGALFFVITIMATAFTGEAVKEGENAQQALAEPAGVVAARLGGGTEKAHEGGLEVPGSLVLCMVLLGFLIVYWTAQYKYLSTIWSIH